MYISVTVCISNIRRYSKKIEQQRLSYSIMCPLDLRRDYAMHDIYVKPNPDYITTYCLLHVSHDKNINTCNTNSNSIGVEISETIGSQCNPFSMRPYSGSRCKICCQLSFWYHGKIVMIILYCALITIFTNFHSSFIT